MATNMIRMVFAVAITLVAYAPASTEAAKAVGPVYEVMSKNSNTCSTGFKSIINCDDCEAAWNELKTTMFTVPSFFFKGDYATNAAYPLGCFLHYTDFLCNSHSTGAPDPDRAKVCKRANYEIMSKNTNTCSTGFKSIDSTINCNDCEAAYNELKTEDGFYKGTLPDNPSGCFIAGSFFCNTHSTGAPELNSAKICKRAPSTPGPTTNPSPGPTTNPSPGPTTNPTSSPTLDPVSVAATAFDEVVDYFRNVGPDHCYTSTSAAKLDIKKLKSKFESYRMEILKVGKGKRTDMMGGAKKALKIEFKKRQKTFAAAKRDLRAKKRAAKLGGKSCRMD